MASQRNQYGALALAQVVSRRFAGYLWVTKDAENVVSQLKRHAERNTEGRKPAKGRRPGASKSRADEQGSFDRILRCLEKDYAVGAANGFNQTGSSWLPQPEIYREYARDQQEGVTGSTLELYKSALRIRRELKLGEGSFDWLPEFTNDRALGYRNGRVLVIHNFGEDALPLPQGSVLLRSVAGTGPTDAIGAHETVWVQL